MAMFDRFKKKEEKPEEKLPEIPPLPDLPPLPGPPSDVPPPSGPIPPPRREIPPPEPLQLPKPEPQKIEVRPGFPGPPPLPKRTMPPPKPEPKAKPVVPRPRVEMPDIKPPTRPPIAAIKPHIFMKIDRYKEVVDTIDKLKDEVSDIKRSVKNLEELDMRSSEKVKAVETIVEKMSELVTFFERSFSTPEE
jgi:hypothetical protein